MLQACGQVESPLLSPESRADTFTPLSLDSSSLYSLILENSTALNERLEISGEAELSVRSAQSLPDGSLPAISLQSREMLQTIRGLEDLFHYATTPCSGSISRPLPDGIMHVLPQETIDKLMRTSDNLREALHSASNPAIEVVTSLVGLETCDVSSVALFPTAIAFVIKSVQYNEMASRLKFCAEGYISIATALGWQTLPDELRGRVLLINEGSASQSRRPDHLIAESITHEVLHTLTDCCYGEGAFVYSNQFGNALRAHIGAGDWGAVDEVIDRVARCMNERARSEILSYATQKQFHLTHADMDGHYWTPHFRAMTKALSDSGCSLDGEEYVLRRFTHAHRNYLADSAELQLLTFHLSSIFPPSTIGSLHLGCPSAESLMARAECAGASRTAYQTFREEFRRAIGTETTRRALGSAAHLPGSEFEWLTRLSDQHFLNVLEAYLPTEALASCRTWRCGGKYGSENQARLLSIIDSIEILSESPSHPPIRRAS